MRHQGHRIATVAVAGAFVASILATPTSAATLHEGALDTSFGLDGQVLDLASGGFGAFDAVVQRDGKILTVDGNAVVRFTTAGQLDRTFGTGGVVSFSAAYGLGSLALQPDGKILLAGNVLRATYDMVVVRLNGNGSRDTTFNSAGPTPGEVDQSVGTGLDQANAVAVQGDGKVLLAGFSTSANPDSVVVRYTSTGHLDSTFGSGGIVNLNVSTNEHFYAVTPGPNGTVIATGDLEPSGGDGTTDVQVVRLTSAGALDTSFDTDGLQTTTLGGGDDVGQAVVVGRSGRIFVAAAGSDTGQVVAYNSNGSLDTNFGVGGGAVIASGATAAATALKIERGGKLVVAGKGNGNGGSDFLVARMSQDGVLDPHFSGDGLATFGFGQRQDAAQAVSVQRNGRLVVAGISTDPASGGDSYPALVRVIGDATPPSAAHIRSLPRYTLNRTSTLHLSSTDDNTGVASYLVRQRSASSRKRSFGSWATVRSALSATKLVRRLSAGRTYCFDARARDYAGNLGALGPARCTASPVDDRGISVSGSWTRGTDARAYRGTVTRSTVFGATATVPVDFRHLALVATTCSTCGSVRVFLGNTFLRAVNLHTTTTHHRVVIALASASKVRAATLRLVIASSGRTVALDGIGVSLV